MGEKKKPARRKMWNRVVALNAIGEPGHLLAAFSSTPSVGVAIYEPELRFQFLNPALAEMNGFPLEAHLGKTIRDILGDTAGLIESWLQRVFTSGEPISKVEVTQKLPTREEAGH